MALPPLLDKKSHFLLGPRQTGKTSLIHRSLPGVRVYDLLDSSVYLALSRDASRLAHELGPRERVVVIDEIPRLPELLNEVHRLIEQRCVHFLLTGSGARKLRSGGVNLLGGRARVKYLQQEIVAEGATRNAPAFSRFLHVAALCNGTIVNFSKVANDAQVARTTVYEYFSILVDTLVLHELPAWTRSKKRKPLTSSKYYFFDPGIVATLQGREFRPGTPEFGEAFETILFHELLAYRDYVSGEPLAYWRSTSGFEVDFLIGDHTAVEAKATATIAAADVRSLVALGEERSWKSLICVCLEPRRRQLGPVTVMPWREFLDALWAGALRG